LCLHPETRQRGDQLEVSLARITAPILEAASGRCFSDETGTARGIRADESHEAAIERSWQRSRKKGAVEKGW
jgi:hypothetical protein